jgi:regulatory protein
MKPANKPCLPAAVKLLAVRDYSEAELRARLVRQGHPAEAIEAAVGELRRRGYLDDEKLGRHLLARYLAGGQHGRRGIGQRLERKGLEPAVVETLLAEQADEEEEYERAAALAAARFPVAKAGDFARIGRYLAARGFADEIVLLVLSRRYDYEDNS